MSFSIACESRNQKEREICSVSFELMKPKGTYNANDHKLIVKFGSTSPRGSTLLKMFEFVTRVRFIENGDDSKLYYMELFQNSPGGGTVVRIEDEFLHCYKIVNTRKRFRFLEMDIDMTPQKWRCLNWELQEEQDGSLTASMVNPYIITP
jgi:hypothetical protein